MNDLFWVLDNPIEARKLGFSDMHILGANDTDTAALRNIYNFLRPHSEKGLPTKTQLLSLFSGQPDTFKENLSSSLEDYYRYKEHNTSATCRLNVQRMMVENQQREVAAAYATINPSKFGTPDALLSALRKSMNGTVATTTEPKYESYTNFDDDACWTFQTERMVPTRWRSLNDALGGGLRCGTAGGFLLNTGGGKSTILHNLCTQLIDEGFNVAYVNLEMAPSDIMSLVSCPLSPSIESLWWLRKNPEQARLLFRQDTADRNLGTVFFLHKSRNGERITPNELRDILLEYQEEHSMKFDVVIVDYFFLMGCDGDGAKLQKYEMEEMVTERMHDIAVAENWAVVSAWQKNRPSKDKSAGGLSTMAGSYNSSFKVDWIFDVKRQGDISEFTAEKLRQGGKVGQSFHLRFSDAKSQLDEVGEGELGEGAVHLDDVVDILHDRLSQGDIARLLMKHYDDYCFDFPKEEKKVRTRISNRVTRKKYGNGKGFVSTEDWNAVDFAAVVKEIKDKRIKPVLGLDTPLDTPITGKDLF